MALLMTLAAMGVGMGCSSSDGEEVGGDPSTDVDSGTGHDAGSGEDDGGFEKDAGNDADVGDDGGLVDDAGDAGDDDAGDADAGDDGGSEASGWSKAYPAGFQVHRTLIDGEGNIVIVGNLWQEVDFGQGPLAPIHPDGFASFIAKFDGNGNALWSRTLAFAELNELFTRIAIDDANDIFVAGSFRDTIDLGGDELESAGGVDVFLAKLASDGTHVFSKSFGGEEDDQVGDMAMDADGNLVLTGWFEKKLSFGGDDLVSTGFFNGYVAKLTSEGGHVFSKAFGVGGAQTGDGVAVGPGGEIVVVGGLIAGEIGCQGKTYEPEDGKGYVMKLAPNGECSWLTQRDLSPWRVVIDDLGNVFGNGASSLVKLDGDGKVLWQKRFEGTGDFTDAFVVDGAGNAAVCGDFFGDLGIDGDVVHSAADDDEHGGFVFFFDPSGALREATIMTATKRAACHSIAYSTADDLYVLWGQSAGEIDLGHGPLEGDVVFGAKLKLLP